MGDGQGEVVGVWVGNDDNSPMNGVVGGGEPAKIWKAFMLAALNRPAPVAPVEDPLADLGLGPEDGEIPGGAAIPTPPTLDAAPNSGVPQPPPAPSAPASPTAPRP